MSDQHFKSMKEEAIRKTHDKMIKKYPEQKKLLDIILEVKLEALKK